MPDPQRKRQGAKKPDVAKAKAEQRARPRRLRDGTSDVEQRVFAATEHLLASVSLVHLRVEDIAAQAGVSRRTFYGYFPAKEEVLIQLAARFMEQGARNLDVIRGEHPGETGREALARVVEANCRLWAEHRSVLRAMTENSHLLPELRAMWLRYIEIFAEDVAAEIDRERTAGVAPPGGDSRRLASLLLWSTGHCLYIAGLGIDEHLRDEASISQELLALWMGAIYGDTAPPAG